MKGLFRNSLLVGLMLCAHALWASSVSHSFNTMTSSEIVFSEDNKVGTTDLCTYRCEGNATFGLDGSYTKILSVSNGSSGTSTVAVANRLHNLKEIQITLQSGENHEAVKVYKSLDGENWGEPLAGTYTSSMIILPIPQSDYYIKIENTTKNNKQRIYSITYYFGDCECKAVVFE